MSEEGYPPSSVQTRREFVRLGVGAVAAGLVGSSVATPVNAVATSANALRLEQSFDEDWRFHRGDVSGADAATYDDSSWRSLDVPHDWRIEDLSYAVSDDCSSSAEPSVFATSLDANAPRQIGPFDADADPAPDIDQVFPAVGRIVVPGGRSEGYTVGGIGWYRKHFVIPKLAGNEKQLSELRFDGVFRNCDVWLNGTHLGFHPNGYTSFAYDMTPHLNAEGENVLAVRVANGGKPSRWYSGSGIYRHTWLTVTGPIRIPLWGVRVTTPAVAELRSTIHAEVQINNTAAAATTSVRMRVLNPQGRQVATQTTPGRTLATGQSDTHIADLTITNAALWSPSAPELYQLVAEVLADGKVVDSVTQSFGIRSLVFDGTHGFLLNGSPYKINGGNIHHDHGPLGALAIDRAEERTIEIMKAAGFNAIRASHNPRSPYMLDVCDRMGMLVYNEFTDVWDIPKTAGDYHLDFPDWWQRDLTDMVLRDRNHPSVIIWSIGNEIPEDPNKYGKRLAGHIRSLDITRPIALGGMDVGKIKDAWEYVDIGDYHGMPTQSDHLAHPDKAFIQSEYPVMQMYAAWKLQQQAPWFVGSLIWSGWDYMGEAGAGPAIIASSQAEAMRLDVGLGPALGKVPYPWYSNFQSDIDLIGQRKPQNFLRAVMQGTSPLELLVERPTPTGIGQFSAWYSYFDELPSWTWKIPDGQMLTVHAYSYGESVQLLLNDVPLATKPITEADKFMATFTVP